MWKGNRLIARFRYNQWKLRHYCEDVIRMPWEVRHNRVYIKYVGRGGMGWAEGFTKFFKEYSVA